MNSGHATSPVSVANVYSQFSAPFNRLLSIQCGRENLLFSVVDKIAIPTARYLSLLCFYILPLPSWSLYSRVQFLDWQKILLHLCISHTIIINGMTTRWQVWIGLPYRRVEVTGVGECS